MGRVVPLGWIEDLEAHILDRDLTMLDAQQLSNEELEVVFDLH